MRVPQSVVGWLGYVVAIGVAAYIRAIVWDWAKKRGRK